ncbi:hypothetical protein P8452_17444 [Trifolium repens]|nr:hypothetical protein P8452_17444 [Trifolium repens]
MSFCPCIFHISWPHFKHWHWVRNNLTEALNQDDILIPPCSSFNCLYHRRKKNYPLAMYTGAGHGHGTYHGDA